MSQSSWKTTISGIVSAFMSFILFSHVLRMIEWPQWALAVAMFALAGGLLSFGISAKDYNVTGTGGKKL
jgi:ATP/ADP translocase